MGGKTRLKSFIFNFSEGIDEWWPSQEKEASLEANGVNPTNQFEGCNGAFNPPQVTLTKLCKISSQFRWSGTS